MQQYAQSTRLRVQSIIINNLMFNLRKNAVHVVHT
jgi:hypothetical protein